LNHQVRRELFHELNLKSFAQVEPRYRHVPMHMIEENMAKQLEWCGEAPFYTLGPWGNRSGRFYRLPVYLPHGARPAHHR
jgi:hypothetical protein